jgi:hypothetical protein
MSPFPPTDVAFSGPVKGDTDGAISPTAPETSGLKGDTCGGLFRERHRIGVDVRSADRSDNPEVLFFLKIADRAIDRFHVNAEQVGNRFSTEERFAGLALRW